MGPGLRRIEAWEPGADRLLDQLAHRRWSPPESPWIGFQRWTDVLFAHWPVPAEVLRPLVPAPLVVDTFEGTGWIGVVPFRLATLRGRGLPPLPGLTDFPELNVRTYVRHQGRGGVYFFSLDAANRLAVLGARLAFGLPYHDAEMKVRRSRGWIHYRSRRLAGDAVFRARYQPAGAWFEAERGSLPHFLTERYCLFTAAEGHARRVDIHHPPWRLRPAAAEIDTNTVVAAAGVGLPALPPLLHYAVEQRVLTWAPTAD